MRHVHTILARLAGLFRRKQIERELGDEIQFHLDMASDEKLRQGLSPSEASAAAKRSFGGVEQMKEQYRDRRGLPFIEVLVADLLYSVRMICRRPALHLLLILIFALGIGVNTAVFSVVDGVLLRPLPFAAPDELVRVWYAGPRSGEQFMEASYADVVNLRNSGSFQRMTGFSTTQRTLNDDLAEPAHVLVGRLSDDLSAVLEQPPSAGRTFIADDFERNERVVVLSRRLWQDRYHGRMDVIGQPIRIDTAAYRIIGVAGAHDFPQQVDLWRPLSAAEKADEDRELQVIARLNRSMSVQHAATSIRLAPGDKRKPWLQNLHAMVVREVRTPLLLQLAAVGVVLLIACVNISNLLLAHGWKREKEIAIRSAIGATTARIVRQLVTEALLLAIAGGALGVLAGAWGVSLIRLANPGNIPRLAEVAVDTRAAAAMALLSALAGIGAALAPAIQVARPGTGIARSSSWSSQPSNAKFRQALVVAEISLSTLLLISAGLVLKSFNRMLTLDRGYKADHVLAVPISLRAGAPPDVVSFYDAVLQNVRAIPGVEHAALGMRTPVDVDGLRVSFNNDSKVKALFSIVTPDYFATMRLPLLSGRPFDPTDRKGRRRVAIVNETLARTTFPNESAVGQLLHTSVTNEDLLIVGVAANATPEANMPQDPAIYVPFYQVATPDLTLLVRTASEPTNAARAIRAQIWSLNSTIALDNIHTLDDQLAAAMAAPRFHTELLGLFAMFALLLASLGVYGVIADWVGEREREIGIRRALGARAVEVVWLVLRSGLRLTLCGVGIGIVSALWLEHLLTSLLFEVSPNDPGTFTAVALFLTLVAMMAGCIPAWRALRIDPAQALRSE